jgi:hypothetical protein
LTANLAGMHIVRIYLSEIKFLYFPFHFFTYFTAGKQLNITHMGESEWIPIMMFSNKLVHNLTYGVARSI